jgi:L-iditol 2-dehydrogenase
MKAAFWTAEGVTLREIPIRSPGPDEILLKVEACGICGTDLLEPADGRREGGFGHEIAGEILETGSAVLHLRPGQKIALESSSACGLCAQCRNARQELCSDLRHFGKLGQFGMAERMIAPAVSAVPYEGLTPDVACLSEPLGVAIDMVRLAEIHPDAHVLIMGPGPIGLMALALVRRMGVRRIFVAAHNSSRARIALANRWGADAVFDPQETPLDRYDFGGRLDRALVTTPPATLPAVARVMSRGGIISFIGIRWGQGTWATFDINDFHFRKLQLRASFASPALFTPLALQYLQDGLVDGPALISHRFPLSRIADAVAAARDRASAIKVVVHPNA